MWLTSITIMATGAPPVPEEYLERGWVRGDECGAYTNVCWWALKHEGIGPLAEHPRSGTTWLRTIGRLSRCESGHNRWTRFTNTGGTKPGSIDRGVMQINNEWWPNISDDQAHNPLFAYRWSASKLRVGLEELWTCWGLTFGRHVAAAD